MPTARCSGGLARVAALQVAAIRCSGNSGGSNDRLSIGHGRKCRLCQASPTWRRAFRLERVRARVSPGPFSWKLTGSCRVLSSAAEAANSRAQCGSYHSARVAEGPWRPSRWKALRWSRAVWTARCELHGWRSCDASDTIHARRYRDRRARLPHIVRGRY